MKRILLILFFKFLLIFSFSNVQAQDRRIGKIFATRSQVIAQNGMVATSQPLAAQIGLQILKKGGNAVDAAIAVDAALGVMSPQFSGIGGDLFAIVWSAKENKLYGINASGPSPQGLSFKQMQNELKKRDASKIPARGMLPITVPGCVSGWFQLHKKLGSMPIKKILSPAIKYAKEGVPVSQTVASDWQRQARSIEDQPGAFKKELTIDGRGPKEGEIFKNPNLAQTLTMIANNGRYAFYEGEIADRIDNFMRENGGYLRKKDLQDYRSEWVKPVSVNYRGYDVYELPPNGQGLAVLQMLQILEEYNLSKMGYGSVKALHKMIEAKKLVYEDRAKLYADPDFANIPIQRLISEKYATKRRKKIGEYANQHLEAGTSILKNGDTVYLTTADDQGNMVSLIQSQYHNFGSGIVVPSLGFTLQDRGQLFSMDPNHPNVYQPDKRPFHTIIPSFVMKNGKPFMSFGVMSGAMQPQGQVQVLTNIIDFGMNVQEAGDAPRWGHGGSTDPTDSLSKHLQDGGGVIMESGFPYSVVRGLERRGHQVSYEVAGSGYGGYQAIMKKDSTYYGASEPRQDGQAVGY